MEELTITYGDHAAVRDLSLSARDEEVVAVVGPSGCGKSTLLRAVAGLEPPIAGRITLDGVDLAPRRPDQRDVGLMFQDHALFPHRTVAENVAFGPRMHGWDRTTVAARVAEVLALVDLTGTDDRRVTELSGGEQQRVALARAIAPRPRLLMLDEPLGSLDRALRDRLMDELPNVFARLGTTVLYVTHDQDEALALADRVVVMSAGRVEQAGTPAELWRTPATEFVARFLGLEPVLVAQVRDGVARTVLGPLPVEDVADGPARLVLLLDALRLVGPSRPRGPDEIPVAGEVTGHRFAGDHLRLGVRSDGGHPLTVPVWGPDVPDVGSRVELALARRGIHVLGHAPGQYTGMLGSTCRA